MKQLIIWGGTGQSIVLEEFLCPKEYNILAVFDNSKDLKSPFNSVPIYVGEKGFKNWVKGKDPKKLSFIVAIAGWRGKDRFKIHQMLKEKGISPVTAVHPAAFVARNAKISEGCQIIAKAAIGARSKLGECVIVNTSASIDHECIIGKGTHIAPGAHVAGCVQIGEFSFLGIGSTVLPRIKIGNNVIVGAGSVVTRDLPDNVVAYGVPARVIRENKQND